MIMRWIKRIVGMLAGIAIFGVGMHRLNYMYAVDSTWERIMWHSFYEDRGKIDNLYLGSSHVYCDINPFALDQYNGQYNFNLSSSSQRTNGTYYLLKEADKYNDLAHVYVELYYLPNTKNNFDGDEAPIEKDISPNWNNTDYMKFSLNKLEYMLTMAGTEKYPDIFLRFSRYRSHLDDWEYVQKTVERKNSEDYANYIYHTDRGDETGYDEYGQRGWFYSTRTYQDQKRVYYQERVLGKNPMAEKSEMYLRKVIMYCQKRDIPITLFISPIYELQLISTENYDNYLNQVKAIATEYHVDIYDFNLVKEEYLPIQETRYFKDIGHLNTDGANLYTNFFYEVMSGSMASNKNYFYDSYAEKLQNTTPCVYGIYCHDEEQVADKDTIIKNMWVASNRECEMEYRIILTPDEGDQYMVQDFDENKRFAIDSKEHGICTVVYRVKSTPDTVQTIEVNY